MTINYKKTAWNDNASGYTPITPTRLNNIESALKSVCDGWDSVSRTTLYAAGGWYVQRAGGFVWVMAKDVKTGSGSWDKVACPYALPAGLRPSVDVQVPMLTGNGGSWTGYMTIFKTGAIEVGNYGNAGSADKRVGSAMFPIGF